jgi:hypothetical protein
MTFKESIESLTHNTDWRSFVDENFNRKSGVYHYLVYSETKILIDKKQIHLPNKIVFNSGYKRFRMKESKVSEFEYRKKKYKLLEKRQIIPFGTYERKFKFSGSFSQILNDILKESATEDCLFSNKLLETGNYPLFGIDSNIKYPSYLVKIKQDTNSKTTSSIEHQSINEEEKDAIKEILGYVGVHYEPYEIQDGTTFIIFPLPYIRIVENRLNTKGETEGVNLTIEFNKDFHNVFKSNKIELQYEISDIDKERKDESKVVIEFDGKRFVELMVRPKNISKIGLCKFKILINNVEVNQFQGTYIRGFKINTKIIEK